MHTLLKTAAGMAALCGLLASCAPSGYYDSNGQYRVYGASDSANHNTPQTATPAAAASSTTYVDVPSGAATTVVTGSNGSTTSLVNMPARTTTTTYTRDDESGDDISQESGPHVPPSMLPPQGMCRVWFPERMMQYQPPVESCSGIRERVPSGAFVVYG